MKLFETKRYITRSFLLCPACLSNDLYHNLKSLKDEDSYTDENRFLEVVTQILKWRKEQRYTSWNLRITSSYTVRKEHVCTWTSSNLLNDVVNKHPHIQLTIAMLAQSMVVIPRVVPFNMTQFTMYKTGEKSLADLWHVQHNHPGFSHYFIPQQTHV